MAEQSYANHTRFHPPFHFFLAPGSIVLVVLAAVNAYRNSSLEAWTLLLMAVLFFVAVFLVRVNPLRAQDRIIRLEERLRMQTLLSAALAQRIPELTEAQLIALRFASDGELPGLVEKVLAAKMPAKEIKKSIAVWRADNFRV